MAELTIDPATIRKALDDFVEAYTPSETPTHKWAMWRLPVTVSRM